MSNSMGYYELAALSWADSLPRAVLRAPVGHSDCSSAEIGSVLLLHLAQVVVHSSFDENPFIAEVVKFSIVPLDFEFKVCLIIAINHTDGGLERKEEVGLTCTSN